LSFRLKLFLGSVLALVLGLAVASPVIVSNLELGPKANIGVDIVYAHFEVQEFSQNVTGLWRNLSDPQARNLRFVSYFIVLNVTNHSDELATLYVFEVAAAPKIVVEGVSVSIENAIATDARDLHRGYPAFFSQFWSPNRSRLIGLTGMKTVPEVVYSSLTNGSIYLYGRVEGQLYGGPSSSGFGLKHVQLQMFGKEFLYNSVVSENQLLIIDNSNGLDVRVEPRR